MSDETKQKPRTHDDEGICFVRGLVVGLVLSMWVWSLIILTINALR